MIWHLLSDSTVRCQDLGPGFYDTRINAERRKRNHVRQLEALGYKVTLERGQRQDLHTTVWLLVRPLRVYSPVMGYGVEIWWLPSYRGVVAAPASELPAG